MTPAMPGRLAIPRIVGTLAFITLTGCQSDAPTSLQKMPRLDPNPRLTVYDPSTRTLGVSLAGTYRFTGQTDRTVVATVTGGNGTYYYEWYQQPCYSTYCIPQYLNGAGWGMSSSSFHLTADMSWVKIIVEVFDSPNLPYSAGMGATLIGPAPQQVEGNFKCQIGDEHYPIHDYYPDSAQYYGYYRDGCTGEKVDDPDHPRQPWMF